MAVDAAQMGGSVAPDTASVSTDAPAVTSEPTEAATAVESHSDPSPTLGDSPTPESSDSAEAGEPESEAPELNDDGTQKPSRADRQFHTRLDALLKDPDKAREVLGPAIEPLLQQALAAREQEQQTKAQQAEAEAKAKQADTEWQQRFADLVGTPEVHTSLNQEIAALTREIVSLKPYGDNTSLDVLEEKQTLLDQKLAQREQLAANQKLYDEIDRFQFARMSNDFLALADSLPPEHAALYRQAQTPAAALVRLEAGIVAREAAKAEARVKAVEAEWSGKLAKEQAAHAATRTGAPASGPSPNGANGVGGGAIRTREQFMALPIEQRAKMRREQPSVVDEIYRRSA